MPPTQLNAVVTQRVDLAPGLMILRVAPDAWTLPDFIPGQFAVLGMPAGAPRVEGADPESAPEDPTKLVRRSYSIASSSNAREFMEFYINLVSSGELTPRLFALKPGDRLWLGPKVAGLFTLDPVPENTNLLLMATGTGIAPYMSMLRTFLTAKTFKNIAILHGARHSWDLGYASELSAMARLCDTFLYIPTISRPQQEPVPWRGQTGYIQDLWRKRVIDLAWGFHPAPADTCIFLCGNPEMIDDTLKLLAHEGFKEHSKKTPGHVHLERYW